MKLSIYMVMCWGTIIHIVENEIVIYFFVGQAFGTRPDDYIVKSRT